MTVRVALLAVVATLVACSTSAPSATGRPLLDALIVADLDGWNLEVDATGCWQVYDDAGTPQLVVRLACGAEADTALFIGYGPVDNGLTGGGPLAGPFQPGYFRLVPGASVRSTEPALVDSTPTFAIANVATALEIEFTTGVVITSCRVGSKPDHAITCRSRSLETEGPSSWGP